MAKNMQGKVQFHLKEGTLHRAMGVKAGQKIPVSALDREKAIAKHKHDTTLERKVQFALNARHFNHK